jgi:hypothetical protein
MHGKISSKQYGFIGVCRGSREGEGWRSVVAFFFQERRKVSTVAAAFGCVKPAAAGVPSSSPHAPDQTGRPVTLWVVVGNGDDVVCGEMTMVDQGRRFEVNTVRYEANRDWR